MEGEYFNQPKLIYYNFIMLPKNPVFVKILKFLSPAIFDYYAARRVLIHYISRDNQPHTSLQVIRVLTIVFIKKSIINSVRTVVRAATSGC